MHGEKERERDKGTDGLRQDCDKRDRNTETEIKTDRQMETPVGGQINCWTDRKMGLYKYTEKGDRLSDRENELQKDRQIERKKPLTCVLLWAQSIPPSSKFSVGWPSLIKIMRG